MGAATGQQAEDGKQHWVDSVFSSLDLRGKIAQTLMIRTYSNKDKDFYDNTEKLIKELNIGGLCFFQGGPESQAKLVNRYQSAARTPLFVAQDAEWGLGMRLDSTFSFPLNMTLGAIQNDTVIYLIAAETARQLKAVGVNINFAPVVDINFNPKNPVINSRSFGENKQRVAKLGVAYMKGLQNNGIIATAKHFPGHGDTDTDSHFTLPVINHSAARIDSIEMYPFRQLVSNGLKAVMTAHLYIPALDPETGRPSTLSSLVVDNWLTDSLCFEGLKITDALDMKGVTSGFGKGEIEIKAMLAGNDILLLPQDPKIAIEAIEKEVIAGAIPEAVIDSSCKKILGYKYDCGLHHREQLQTKNISQKLHSTNNLILERVAYKNAITLIDNKKSIVPLNGPYESKIATLSIGSAEITPFQQMLENYLSFNHYCTLKGADAEKLKDLLDKLDDYEFVIVGIHNTSMFPQKNFGINKNDVTFLETLASKTNVILDIFGSPYAFGKFDNPEVFSALICSYQDNRISQELSAQAIMGAIPFAGKLPVSINLYYPEGTGIYMESLGKFEYSSPEYEGVDGAYLQKIDSIALDCINKKAAPGCQVFVAVNGKVIYNKAFGYHTYTKGTFVKTDDIYDLASLTKIAATTLSAMKLSDDNKMDIDEKLVKYLPCLKGTDKENIIIRELMAHQARLRAWIPFNEYVTIKGEPDTAFFRKELEEGFSTRVAKNLFIKDDYSFTMYDTIIASKLLSTNKYRYSDLGFYLLKKAIENISNQRFDTYVDHTFYRPLGLKTMTFNPLNKFELNRITPTENEKNFRKQLIHGHVHDPGAAMLGGISGHAGLFSDAADVAVIMQMLLQKGFYGGRQYIRQETVEEFTKQQFPLNDNRRGIGFDKPNTDGPDNGPACNLVSPSSFGHTGFTGTYAWADPEYGIVYVFLSNRVHPDATVNKLAKLNTRTEIQKVIYEAVLRKNEIPDK